MLTRISSAELTEWEAFERVNGPIGGERLDQLFGMLAATIANSNRSKRSQPYQASQFIPKWDPEARPERKPEMDGREMLAAIRRYNKTMGG